MIEDLIIHRENKIGCIVVTSFVKERIDLHILNIIIRKLYDI